MNDRVPCEFFVVRYVPDIVKGEFVNIGIVLREVEANGREGSRAAVRFTRNWSRVRCVHADADIDLLKNLEDELTSRLKGGRTSLNPQGLIDTFGDTLSNSVQMTEARGCLAEDIPTELEQLMRMYVEPFRETATREKTGRAAISAAMRVEFEQAGVWSAMRKRIAASAYTQVGDTLKIDCGYRVGPASKVIQMFHAVSLEEDVRAAKALAYSAREMQAGVQRVEEADLKLTAVVETLQTDSDEIEARYRFGVETMEREAVRVVSISDLARVAQTSRQELGL